MIIRRYEWIVREVFECRPGQTYISDAANMGKA
jgi:hypothetical protein